VEFGALDDRIWTVGADAALDTRGNPAFPANAVYLGAGWTALNVRPGAAGAADARINRYTVDGRGYLRLYRQAVLAARAQFRTADARLPVYERWLIGGSDTLRGFRTGSFDGDKAFVTSAELRVPITDVTSGGKVGAVVFFDAARVAEHGTRLEDAEWRRGAGAGMFLIASVIRINVSLARNVDGGGTRLHLSSGFSF
jgi:outer membrane protein insertion porin family